MAVTAETSINRRTFTFREESAGGEVDKPSEPRKLVVQIEELLRPSYGMYVWPSAVVLAQFIWHNRSTISGRDVLELGAGCSLPGIVAAKCGAKVTLTDSALHPDSVDHCRRNCEVNGLANVVAVRPLTWGNLGSLALLFGKTDYVVASDCFYDPNDFEDILATVSFLLEQHNGSAFWCTYQIRSNNWSIEDLLSKWKLTCKSIPLAAFGGDGDSIAGSNLPGRHTILMMEIVPESRSRRRKVIRVLPPVVSL